MRDEEGLDISDDLLVGWLGKSKSAGSGQVSAWIGQVVGQMRGVIEMAPNPPYSTVDARRLLGFRHAFKD